MAHVYNRNGITSLFAALNVLDGTVIGCKLQRHRHQEFIRFLNVIEAEVPAGKAVHMMLDNYATHNKPKVAPMACPPRMLHILISADIPLLTQRCRGSFRKDGKSLVKTRQFLFRQ